MILWKKYVIKVKLTCKSKIRYKTFRQKLITVTYLVKFNSHLAGVRRVKNRARAIMKSNRKGSVLKPFQQGSPSGHQRNAGGQNIFAFNRLRYQSGQSNQIKEISEVNFLTASFTNRIDYLCLVSTSELKRVYPVAKDLSGEKNILRFF